MTSYQRRNVVLCSGGLDSSTLLAWLAKDDPRVESIFVDYGQPAAVHERNATIAISTRLGCGVTEYRVSGPMVVPDGEIAGRNALLLILALWHLHPSPGVVHIGVHNGPSYPDCSPTFLRAQQSIFDMYAQGTVVISAPFSTWSKDDILRAARDLGVPTEATYSCERGTAEPCRECASCKDRIALDARAI